MKNSRLQTPQTAFATRQLLAAVALGAVLGSQYASAGTAYTLSTLTSGGLWATPGNWTPGTSTAGPGNTSGVYTDTASLPLGTLTGAWNLSLNSSPTIAGFSLAYAGAYASTINAGTPANSFLTFHGTAPAITNTSGQTLTINPPVYLDTANAILTISNNGTVYIANPGGTFFSNLNAAGGLPVGGGTLQLGNVTNNLPPLTTLKSGPGQLTLNLATNPGVAGSFFTNQTLGLGGTGVRVITGVISFTNASGAPLVLTNNSTSILELDLSTAVSPTNFFGSFGGISSLSGLNGNIKIKNIAGTNSLGALSLNTSVANQSLYLFGNGGSILTNVLAGGNFNVNELALLNGVTLNVDSQNSGFSVKTLTLSSGNSSYDYAKGAATVNWNASGKTVGAIYLNSQGGGPASINFLGGGLTNTGAFNLGSTSHNSDNSTSTLNISGGVLGITNVNGLTMSPVGTASSGGVGPKEYSFLTITNTGVLNVVSPGAIKPGSVTALDTNGPIYSQATISLGGGTLKLGTPIGRQPVATMINGSSANWVQFYFNGGTLLATTNLAQVFTNFGTVNSSADAVYVGSGGAVINNGGFTVGISNALLAASGSTGGLTNLGNGTLTLSGANTYTGPTVTSAGKLIIPTTSSFGSSGFFVADGATNQVVVATPGTTLSLNSLTLGTGSGATIEFNTAALGSPSAAIVAAGSVALNGTATVNIYGSAWTAGTYQLLTYYSGETINGGSGFVLGTLPLGVNATLNDTGTELDLVISSANNSLTWNGNAGSVWDINNNGNANWLGQPAAVPAWYVEAGSVGLPVTFDDTATGTTAIILNTTVHPASVTVNNNTLNYSITGSGAIAGPLPLTLNSTGIFTIGVANNFTNPVINSGTLGLTNANNILPVTDTVTFGGAPGTPAVLDLGGNSQSLTNINFLTANTAATAGTLQNGKLTVTTNGFNPLSSIAPAATSGLLDLSGLSSFTSSNTAQTFTVQDTAATNGTFKLNLAGGLNNITAGTINVGSGGGPAIPTGVLYLGQTNIVNASTITLGAYRGSGNVYFESGLASSNVTLRGTAGGTNRVTTLTIGAQSSGASQNFTMDLGAANVDALVGTLYAPNTLQPGIAETGTLNFGNGTFDILTLDLAFGSGIGNGVAAGTVGNFNQNGGLAKIQTLNLGVNPNTGTPALKPSYTLNGGTLAAGNITAWGATAFNNVYTVRNLNLNGGTITNYDANTDLTISGVNASNGGVVNLVLGAATTSTLNAGAGRTIIVQTNALIGGAGNLSVTGGGTVVLDGGGNTYAGLTTVANGTLKIVAGDTALGTVPASATANQLTLNGGTLALNQGWAGGFSGFSPGSGYTNFPTVTLNQVSGASILAQGGIAGFKINTAGNLLTNVTVLIAPPDQAGGVQATATANFTTGSGLTGITVTTTGSGYTTPPNVNFTVNTGATTPAAAVTNVTLVGLVNANPGYNYTGAAPTVTINGGGGSGASATANATATAGITLAGNRGLTLGAAGGTIDTLGNHTINGIVAGPGALTKTGAGTLTLANANTYAGNTVISAGRLALADGGSFSNSPLVGVAGGAILDVSGLSSPLTLGGNQTLSNSASATGTLVGNLSAGAGTNSVSFNAGTPAFTVTNGTYTLPATSTFIVNNTGAALAAGSYKIISTNTAGFVAGALANVTVIGGGLATSTSASLSVSNSELYVVVQNATITPPTLNFTATGGGSSLQFSWAGSYKLQSQTNSLTTGLGGTGWYDYPGGTSSPVTVTVDPSKGCVFFRLSQ